jgi:hypothetical protein
MATTISASTNSEIISPYSNAATKLRMEQLQSIYGESSQATNEVVATMMGIQLQRRKGAVKKCKKEVLSS